MTADPLEAGATMRRRLMLLFLLCFLVPIHLHFGSITMGLPRFYLLLAFFPALFTLLTARDLRIGAVDYLIFAFILWASLAILVNHGMTEIEFVGLQIVDMFGAYLAGRALIRTPQDYRYFWRLFAWCMLFMFPIALVELLTNRFILHDLLRPFFDVFDNATIHYPPRWGFDRVQGNLEHPILFGVFWSLGFSSMLVVFKSHLARVFFAAICLSMVFMSLSSGAYLVAIFQSALLAWGWLTRGSWKTLLALFAIMYVIVEIISDRPAILAISTRLAFSSDTAYWRAHIWNFGLDNVLDNPIFGLGLRDWVRPHWLSASVDNNWLLIAMRGGIPAIVFMLAAFAAMIWQLTSRKDLEGDLQRYRRSFVIMFLSMFVALGTVAVWSGTQSFLFFLLAIGVNLANMKQPGNGQQEPEPEAEPASRYTRQEARHTRIRPARVGMTGRIRS